MSDLVRRNPSQDFSFLMFQAVSTNADKLEWTEINLEQTSFALHTGCAVDDSKKPKGFQDQNHADALHRN